MDELAKRFADLADKYGPQVANAALSAARVEAYSTLVASLEEFVIGAVFLLVAKKLAAFKTKDDFYQVFPYIGAGLCGIIGLLLVAGGLWSVIDPWTWTALNHPELWLAKKAFKI